jgi:hypothetical protein
MFKKKFEAPKILVLEEVAWAKKPSSEVNASFLLPHQAQGETSQGTSESGTSGAECPGLQILDPSIGKC